MRVRYFGLAEGLLFETDRGRDLRQRRALLGHLETVEIDAEGEVTIGYRKYPDGAMQQAQKLLEEIVADAAM